MKDVFDSFSIGDFVFQSENMTYSEFLAFCKLCRHLVYQ